MTAEDFYKKEGHEELDKFDKKAPLFDYYFLMGFAENYHQAKLKEKRQGRGALSESELEWLESKR